MEYLSRYFPDLTNSGVQVDVVSSSPSEHLHVYTLSFALEKSSTNSTSITSFNLGRRGDSVTNGLRLTRDKCYWLFAHQSYDLPSQTDTQILALLGSGLVIAVLPLTTSSYMGTLRGPMFDHEHGSTFVRFEGNHRKPEKGQVAVAIASDLNLAIKGAVKQARVLLKVSDSAVEARSFGSDLFENVLTYCTWNSLQPPTPTTATSALGALESFHAIGVRPAAFLIDDAWQDVYSFRLQSFGSAAPFLDKFKTLGEVVKIAKEKYGVRNVGVWHTIQGYWQGVEPSKFASRYKLVKVTKDGYPGPNEPEGFEYHIPHPDSVLDFFKDYYATLREAGVSFTKCDNMASIDQIASAVEVSFTDSGEELVGAVVDVPGLRKAYVHAAMTAAREAFGAESIIWCMGMTPRVLLGDVGLSGGGVKRVVRNSDDYYPNEPDSHRYHIFTNAINALLLNNLDVQPDLDMFQTHPYVSPQEEVFNNSTGLAQASFHASFRVFGTGPVTITDVPLKSNPEILRKIVGDVSPKFKSPSVVVQASRPFTVLNDVFDPNILGHGARRGLKVYTDNTIGVWNLQTGDKTVVEFITPKDIGQALGLSHSALPPVILYIQSSNSANVRTVVHDLSNTLHPAAPVKVEIGPLGWATVSVAIVESLNKQDVKELGVACSGLVDKYLSPRGVSRSELVQGKQGGWTYTVHVRCSGTLAVWFGSRRQVKGVRASLVGEKDELEVAREVEYRTTELERGSSWATVETKGRSVVTFQLE